MTLRNAPLLVRTATASLLLTGLVLARDLSVGRVGRDFADLQAAVAAAAPGDLIRVDAGSYGPLTVDKPLVIVAAGGSGAPFTLQQVPRQPALRVTGLPAGASLSIVAARVSFTDAGAPAVEIADCAATVRLEDVAIASLQAATQGVAEAALVVRRSTSVWLSRCVVASQGSAGVRVGSSQGTHGVLLTAGSRALVVGCSTRGYDLTSGGGRGGDGLRVDLGSDVHVLATILAGGDGQAVGGDGLHVVDAPASRVVLCGDASSQIGGRGAVDGRGAFPAAPSSCLLETFAWVRTPPTVAIGSPFAIDVGAELPRDVLLVAGRPVLLPSPVPGVLGLAALDPVRSWILGVAVVNGSPISIPLVLPSDPSLRGVQLALQGVALGIAKAPIPTWTWAAMTAFV